MTFGLTDQGFTAKRLVDIVSDLTDAFQATFGVNVDLDNSGPFGQLLGILSEREVLLWEILDQIYQATFVNGAAAIQLDQLMVLANLKRLAAKATVVSVTVVGTPATVLPVGTQMQTSDSATVFETLTAYTIPGSGTGAVNFTATITGPLLVLTGTLTVINTPVTGWTSGSNAADGTIGRDIETDTAMRSRRLNALSTIVSSSSPGVISAAINVTNVVEVKEVENSTGATDSDGRSAHSYELVVDGGDDSDLLAAIFRTKPSGIQTVGTTSGTVVDLHGDGQSVSFSRPVDVPIYITVNLTVGPTFPASGLTDVRNAILAYGQASQRIGQDVYPFPIEQAVDTAGIEIMQLYIGTLASPGASDPIIIGNTSKASFDSSRLIVTRVN